jgi:hypothetical protein
MVAFTPDEICRSFLVEDVTDSPAQLRIAFDLVAAGYSQLASTPLDPQEIREELCADSYHRHGLARTLLLIGANPNTGTVEPLGTLRIVLGYAHTATLGMRPLRWGSSPPKPGGRISPSQVLTWTKSSREGGPRWHQRVARGLPKP